ncbi:MAG: hydantoinase B/oxoprolinase family protein [Rhodospirillaceae bacterium]
MLWQFWIDRGGTFTDIVARAPDGEIITRKLLSENPSAYRDAAIAGIRAILTEREGLAQGAPLPADRIEVIKLGTTIATNALLTRAGEPTVLAVTEGFGDALRIGAQNRPRLFDLDIKLPDMLYGAVVEVRERMSADGAVSTPLDEAHIRTALAEQRAAGFNAVAIVLMHGYRFSDHEARVAAIAREVGFTQVSVSHQVSALVKLVPRGDTTVADAYLTPILCRYTGALAQACGDTRLLFMQSSGGLAAPDHFHGKDAVLSGPAGGVIGAAETARAAGYERIIGFDMGGTSTDVCLVAGEDYERTFETTVAGVRLRTPMMRVHTVAAGGGSILVFDGLRFRSGPASAGADPGPACYGKGGPLCITDANLLLGRIHPDFFPKVFGAGDAPLDAEAARLKFARMTAEVAQARGRAVTAAELALGFVALAVDNMARAIRKISIERGHDLAHYTLACFGGAGGQHACAVADSLGMSRVFIHPLAGVLSAYGIGLARVRAIRSRSLEYPLEDGGIAAALDELEAAARHALDAQQAVPETVQRRVHLKYTGTDTALVVPFGSVDSMTRNFVSAHRTQFGFTMEGRGLICDMAEAEAIGAAAHTVGAPAATGGADAKPAAIVTLTTDEGSAAAPLFQREDLAPGQEIDGPAVIAERLATTVVDAGWRARVAPDAALVLERIAPRRQTLSAHEADPQVDTMRIELFNNLFMSIAEQMGAVLQNTAQSVNIKERLDFSCAVFDASGQLLANAPHMPVHLGSMGESVRAVMDRHHRTWGPGDSFVVNNPYAGGTHLPDITVVTPVFIGNDTPHFFVASRGHHADVGGATPGSMPPSSRTLEDEGILLDNLVLVRAGVFQDAAIHTALMSGPHPARAPETNLADLRAQLAANAKGCAELARAVADHGAATVDAYVGHVLDHAEEAVRRLIGRLDDGGFTAPMDEGGHVTVRVTIDRAARTATVDFTGTSPQRASNFNAPSAVCRAAVLYVFRTLIADEIPMNEGVLRPITLVIPEGSMLRPKSPAAVVAGNVETSQIICDALYGALGVLAASQGTMNNFTFGNATHQYYETIAGGAGAGESFDGASAVQTHMTNSRLTDPEVLENRFPVTVEHFAVRGGSGGAGAHRGGDGVERRIRFNTLMTAAILSGRRTTRPFGLHGGGDGLAGETRVKRAGGQVEILGPTDEVQVAAGDTITILTPGGGGYGRTKP